MLENIYLYAAFAGGLFLTVQFVMLMLGMADDGGDVGDVGGDFDVDGAEGDQEHWSNKADGDFDAAGGNWFFELFSLRSLSGAALFAGLVGKTSLVYGASQTQAAVYASAAGALALYTVYWVFKQIFKLQTEGNLDIRNAVSLPAKVYVPIPPAGEGAGKVQFKLQSRLVEYLAVNDGAERLSTGQSVLITGVVDANTVSVNLNEPLRS